MDMMFYTAAAEKEDKVSPAIFLVPGVILEFGSPRLFSFSTVQTAFYTTTLRYAWGVIPSGILVH